MLISRKGGVPKFSEIQETGIFVNTCSLSFFLFQPFLKFCFPSSGIFELNFMSSQPTSGYYQFVIAVTGDSRLVANHVEVREVRSLEGVLTSVSAVY